MQDNLLNSKQTKMVTHGPLEGIFLFCFLLFLGIGQASELQSFGCPAQKAIAQDDESVCTFSRGGLVMLCTLHPYYNASEACAAHGYRLAQLTETNLMWAQSLLPNCAYNNRIWIGSLNGLSAEPCLAFAGEASLNFGDYSCLEQEQQVMCQEIPLVTETVSTTTTITFSEGTTTVCTTTTDYRRQHHRHTEDMFIEKKCGPNDNCNQCFDSSPVTSCNCCSDACAATVAGLHVVFGDFIPYSEAAAVCCKHGWRLADLTSGMSSLIHKYILPTCRNSTTNTMATWIRSYEGVDGFQCLELSINEDGLQTIVFGHTDQYCNGEVSAAGRYVLCQEDPALITGNGPVIGSITTSTVFFNATAYETVPSTTTTVTRTVRCRNDFKRPDWITEKEEKEDEEKEAAEKKKKNA